MITRQSKKLHIWVPVVDWSRLRLASRVSGRSQAEIARTGISLVVDHIIDQHTDGDDARRAAAGR